MAPIAPSFPAAELATLLRDSRHWELLRERQAKETRRLVYRVNEQFLVKKFEISHAIQRYRRPWLIEDACLRRLNGDGAPRSFGWYEVIEGDNRVVWLVKDFIDGEPVVAFTLDDLPAVAHLLASIHARGVITDDASAGNFLRVPDGRLVFLDFGRARLRSKNRRCSAETIGWALAKLRREGFNWKKSLWEAFLPLYFSCLGASTWQRTRIRAACAAATRLRQIRKTLQGQSPRS